MTLYYTCSYLTIDWAAGANRRPRRRRPLTHAHARASDFRGTCPRFRFGVAQRERCAELRNEAWTRVLPSWPSNSPQRPGATNCNGASADDPKTPSGKAEENNRGPRPDEKADSGHNSRRNRRFKQRVSHGYERRAEKIIREARSFTHNTSYA